MRHMTKVLALVALCCCGWHAVQAADEDPAVGKITVTKRDSVIVESKIIAPGTKGAVIGIRIVNAMPVMGLTIPLEFRAVTPGAFVTSVAIGFRERLNSALSGTRFTNHYAAKDYTCPDTKTPGYETVVGKGEDTPIPVSGSPWAVMMSAFRFPPAPSLPTGADVAGSLTLTVDVSSTEGTFEIDTTCTYPTNHLMLVGEHAIGELSGLIPVFVKGVITIGQCNCDRHGDINGDGLVDALDYSEVMDHVFFGGDTPPKDASCPHVNRGDMNCDGTVDIRDVLHLREHMYGSGVAVCNPCACASYPVDCP